MNTALIRRTPLFALLAFALSAAAHAVAPGPAAGCPILRSAARHREDSMP